MRKAVCTLALTAFLTLGMAGSAFAQSETAPNTTTPPQGKVAQGHKLHPNRDLRRLTKHLNLTQDQQSQIRPIIEDRDQKLNQLWQDSSISRADRKTKSQQIRDDADSKINAILTPEQRTKYTDMEARHHQKERVEASPGAQDTQPQ